MKIRLAIIFIMLLPLTANAISLSSQNKSTLEDGTPKITFTVWDDDGVWNLGSCPTNQLSSECNYLVFRSTFRPDNEDPVPFSIWIGKIEQNGQQLFRFTFNSGVPGKTFTKVETFTDGTMQAQFNMGPKSDSCATFTKTNNFPKGGVTCSFDGNMFEIANTLRIGPKDENSLYLIAPGRRVSLKKSVFELQILKLNNKNLRNYYDAIMPRLFQIAAAQGNSDAQNGLALMYARGMGVQKSWETAFAWYMVAANQGNAPAQYNLAGLYDLGLGVSENNAEAWRWYVKAANQGYVDAQGAMGAKYKTGDIVSQDFTQAARWLTRAAEQGHVISQALLAELYANGQGVRHNKSAAYMWYILAKNGDHPNAHEKYLALIENMAPAQKNKGQVMVGDSYYYGMGIHQNFEYAKGKYKNAADKGSAEGQYKLGKMIVSGRAGHKDLIDGYAWVYLAAAQGYREAVTLEASLRRKMSPTQILETEFTLAYRYEKGIGVTENSREAERRYRLAANQGLAAAQNKIGLMYSDGKILPKNFLEAVKWFRRAANQGYAIAQANLGSSYAGGYGVTKNDAEAVRWLTLAANQNNGSGQHELGIMYACGCGITKNNTTALMWYYLAQDNRVYFAQYSIENIVKSMTEAQIKEAGRLANNWRKNHR